MVGGERRIVNRADDGQGWVVRRAVGGPALGVYPTKAAAVEHAEKDLRALLGGGELLAFNVRSRQLEARRVTGRQEGVMQPEASATAQRPVSQPSGAAALYHAVDRDGERIDLGLEIVIPIAAMFGTSVVSSAISEADGWFGVFIATLAWSLGWTFTVFMLQRKLAVGIQAFLLTGLCFTASLWIASVVGMGELPVGPMTSGDPEGVWEFLGRVIEAAIYVYGWFGAVVGAAIGSWLGYRLAEHPS